ncbi:TPA: hypothetical protein ACH3X3_002330 [Trebouxia sp. C0006]
MTDGSKYVGGWQAGKRDGQGRCMYASGDQYEGNWKDDKRHGQGTCLFADGTRFRGEWEEDAWLQSAAEPALTRVSGPGLTRALAGQTASFVIQAYDELRNKRLSGGDNFMAHLVGPAGVITHASLEDKEDGTYLVTYCCTAAGMHDLHVTIGKTAGVAPQAPSPPTPPSPQQIKIRGGEERVAESPYSVRVLPVQPVPRKCTVVGPGRTHSTTGELAEFFIEGRDQFGNRCDGDLPSQLPVTVKLSYKPFTCAVSVIPTDDGRYSCMYTPDRSGFYRLEVTSQGIHVYGSPFSVKVSEPNDTVAGKGKAHKLQQSNAVEDVCRPLIDQVKAWEGIAAAVYAVDGSMDGWDDDNKKPQSSEDKYLLAHPDVPVVDNLEDIWLVSKLQEERKAKQKEQERAQQLQQYKQVLGLARSNEHLVSSKNK